MADAHDELERKALVGVAKAAARVAECLPADYDPHSMRRQYPRAVGRPIGIQHGRWSDLLRALEALEAVRG